MSQEKTSSWREGLNSQQLAAVDCPGSALVLAGAGTGKTRVIVSRIARLLEQDVSPSAVLAVTFTNRAANEMRERIGSGAWKMLICTFHSLGLQILRAHPEHSGLPKTFQILDRNDQTVLMRRVLQDSMGLPKPIDGGPDPNKIASFISDLKEKGYRPDTMPDIRRFEGNLPDMQAVFATYEQFRREEGKADFAELLLRPFEMLCDIKEVRQHWADRFEHIMIDELQDINPIQLKILGLLKRKQTIFFGVGDDDQSIYGFRGAQAATLETFLTDFANKKLLKMEQNYRSTELILELANKVISDNKHRLGKTLRGVSGTGSKPNLTCYSDDENEANSVARQIEQLQADGIALDTIAVLYRNHSIAQLVEAALTRTQIPFRIRGGQRFFARAEIRDAIAYLRSAVDNDDREAILRSINNPPRKVGKKTVMDLLATAGDRPLLEVLADSDHPGVQAYLHIVKEIRATADAGDLLAAAKMALVKTGLQDYLNQKNERERAENLGEILNAVARFVEHEATGSLADFLNQITLDDDITEEKAQVTLMTIHAAKGLEFEQVFLLGLEDGVLPGFHDSTEVDEERRLFYVAITRAKRELHMSLARRRRFKGMWRKQSLSKLLDGVPKDMLEIVGDLNPARASNPSQKRPAQRKFAPLANTKRSLNGYQVGQKVRSSRFGPGVVLELEGADERAKAKVLFFKDRKQRWLLLKMANLEKT